MLGGGGIGGGDGGMEDGAFLDAGVWEGGGKYGCPSIGWKWGGYFLVGEVTF